MRIVYLNPSGQLGGAETSLIELLASIREAAPDSELWLVLGQDGPLVERVRGLGVHVEVAPFPKSLAQLGDSGSGLASTLGGLVQATGVTAAYAKRLRRLLRAIDPHLIHTNGLKMHVLGALTRPPNARLVWHIHDYVRSRRLMSRFLQLTHRRCDVAIVNSKSVAADVTTLLPDLKVQPVYNAVDLRRFSPQGAQLDLDALAGLAPAPRDTVRVGLVGTFAIWKGHKVFLEALARLSCPAPVRGYIIGEPIYQTHASQWSMSELRSEVTRLGLTGRMGFTGFVADTAAVMRSLDIVIHASTAPEPFGMVIIEGMACGRAVVASRAGGAVELFTEGLDAISHSPGDSADLAEKIALLAQDPELRRRLGQAARVTAQNSYHGKRLAAEVLAVYSAASKHSLQPHTDASVQSSVPAASE